MTRVSKNRTFLTVCILALLATPLILATAQSNILARLSRIPIWITDVEGTVIYRTSIEPLPIPWGKIERASYLTIQPVSHTSQRLVNLPLHGQSAGYLLFRIEDGFKYVLLITSLEVGLLLAVIFGFLVWYWGQKAEKAKVVLSELRRGNLKARLDESRIDEALPLSQEFNRMANEIECLVEKLQKAESARTLLLQQISHDIRNPLSTLRYVVEKTADSRVPTAVARNMELALGELAFFERMIEDLFLIVQVEDRQYRVNEKEVDLILTLNEEIRTQQVLKKKIDWRVSGIQEIESPVHIQGDPYLLKRLLANALKNAADFARKRVECTIAADSHVTILIRDDGPGFPAEALEHFGRRRATRFIEPSSGERASLGLGTLIMVTVAKALNGTVEARNWLRSSGSIGGAEVKITLPAVHRKPLVQAA